MKRLPFVLLLILLTGLISCGTKQPKAKQSSLNRHSIKVLNGQIDPCSLVTKAQVVQVLKTHVTVAQQPAISNSYVMQYVSCSYFSSDFSTSADIGLETYKDVVTAQAAFEDHKHHVNVVIQVVDGNAPAGNFHVTHQTIPGLGDQAVLIVTPQLPMLYIQKGNAILSITVSDYGQPDSLVEKQEQQLALLAVRNM